MRYGRFIACETRLICGEHTYGVTVNEPLPLTVWKYPSAALKRLVAPKATFGYDIIAYIGQPRFIRQRQRSEIQAELHARGIAISVGEISRLTDLFLVYLEQLHRNNTNRLRQMICQAGGYVLHVDATGENGSDMLLVCYNGLQDITLYAQKIKSETTEEISAGIRKTIELFGAPLAIVHDLGSGMSKATATVSNQWPEVVDLICEFHLLQDIGNDLMANDYDTLRKLFRRRRIAPCLLSLKKKIAAELDNQNQAINYFYHTLEQGNYDELNHLTLNRALIYAMINWILDYKSESNGLSFPFEQPYVTFYNRCHTIGTIVPKLLQNKYVEPESIRDYLLKIYHIVDQIHVDKRFQMQINKIAENLILFNELRNTLHLFDDDKQGINGCRSFHCPQELHDVEQQLNQFHQSLQQRLLTEKLSNTSQRAIAIILKHLEKYQHHLFKRIFEVDLDGRKKLIIADRTNNCLERFFRHIKRFLRRVTGRKNLHRDLNKLPSQVALTFNLLNADYIKTVFGSLDNLPLLFSQLDQQYCTAQLELLQLQRNGDIIDTKSFIKKEDFIEQTVGIYHNFLAKVIFLDKVESANPTVI